MRCAPLRERAGEARMTQAIVVLKKRMPRV